MEIGIIGLPNVGKSTLFNALTCAGAACSNYPFTTIESNVGVVTVPDFRLDRIAEVVKPDKATPATIRFVDIAGLVKGASKGEGLGNKFLSFVREVDALAHLVRAFDDKNVAHVMGEMDFKRDFEIVETELILADLEAVAGRIQRLHGSAHSGDKTAKETVEVLQKIRDGLERGVPVRRQGLAREATREFFLLTDKPVLIVGNVSEDSINKGQPALEELGRTQGCAYISISSKIEDELAKLEADDRKRFRAELGIEESGLQRLIRAGNDLLKLVTFFTTVKGREVRAWNIPAGTTAKKAAGRIHTDMEKGFIAAQVYRFEELDREGSEKALHEKGLIRSEGREYVIQDGDIVTFRFNV